MNKNQSSSNSCRHTYIVCLGKNERKGESYNYCLDCGKRIYHGFYGSLVIDASIYFENNKITTELIREDQVKTLRKELRKFLLDQKMLEEEGISEFKEKIEKTRNQKIKMLRFS